MNSILRRKILHQEYQYLNLIRKIDAYGDIKKGRNGNTKSLFGVHLRYNLQKNKIPLMTTKKLAWKTCLRELLWFISGSTDNNVLLKQNVNIWEKNSTREFLDNAGLNHLKENDLGPVYGHQWRHYNASYDTCRKDYTGQGVDQLQDIVNSLKDPEKRNSRRLILNSWNPCQIKEMALPPCHVMSQFYVNSKNELSVSLYQRSGDVGLGIPFNIASYSFLTHLLAKHCDLEPGEFIHFIGDAHIYDEHLPPLKEQIEREPFKLPTIEIKKKESINNYLESDFKISNYKYHDKISMEMKA